MKSSSLDGTTVLLLSLSLSVSLSLLSAQCNIIIIADQWIVIWGKRGQTATFFNLATFLNKIIHSLNRGNYKVSYFFIKFFSKFGLATLQYRQILGVCLSPTRATCCAFKIQTTKNQKISFASHLLLIINICTVWYLYIIPYI